MRRPAPAALGGSRPKCAEQSSAHQLFLSAKARRKFDAGLLILLDVVDAKPARKLYRYRKVPGAARAPAAAYELYREFRTNRRPLNVASVVSRTVEQETSSVPAPRETGGIDRFRWGFDAWVVCCCANGYHTVVTASTLRCFVVCARRSVCQKRPAGCFRPVSKKGNHTHLWQLKNHLP